MYMSNICKTVTLRTRKINRGDLSIPAKRGSGVSQRGKEKPDSLTLKKVRDGFSNFSPTVVVICLLLHSILSVPSAFPE